MAVQPTAVTPPTLPPQPLKEAPQDCYAVRGFDWDVRTAWAVCMAESGGVATKDNAGLNSDGSVDYGLMQINSIHADMVQGNLESLRNPQTNIKVAYSISKGGTNWTPWSAYKNGSYIQWLAKYSDTE